MLHARWESPKGAVKIYDDATGKLKQRIFTVTDGGHHSAACIGGKLYDDRFFGSTTAFNGDLKGQPIPLLGHGSFFITTLTQPLRRSVIRVWT